MCGAIKLTEEQIYELLGEPHAPIAERSWYDTVVKVDAADKERFLNIVNPKQTAYAPCHGLSRIEDKVMAFSYVPKFPKRRSGCMAVFVENVVADNIAKIESLALLPCQSHMPKMSYSEAEMAELVKKGEAR